VGGYYLLEGGPGVIELALWKLFPNSLNNWRNRLNSQVSRWVAEKNRGANYYTDGTVGMAIFCTILK